MIITLVIYGIVAYGMIIHAMEMADMLFAKIFIAYIVFFLVYAVTQITAFIFGAAGDWTIYVAGVLSSVVLWLIFSKDETNRRCLNTEDERKERLQQEWLDDAHIEMEDDEELY